MITQEIKNKYLGHSYRAENRGIPFTLTLDEWYDIWQKSGHWEERGCSTGKYVMSRRGDEGGYTKENVFIQTHADNLRDSHRINPRHGVPVGHMSAESRARISKSKIGNKANLGKTRKYLPNGRFIMIKKEA